MTESCAVSSNIQLMIHMDRLFWKEAGVNVKIPMYCTRADGIFAILYFYYF